MVEHLPSKLKALSSIPALRKEKKTRRKATEGRKSKEKNKT
jgi:hypothetical protein